MFDFFVLIAPYDHFVMDRRCGRCCGRDRCRRSGRGRLVAWLLSLSSTTVVLRGTAAAAEAATAVVAAAVTVVAATVTAATVAAAAVAAAAAAATAATAAAAL